MGERGSALPGCLARPLWHALPPLARPRAGLFDCKPLAVLWARYPQYGPHNTIMLGALCALARRGSRLEGRTRSRPAGALEHALVTGSALQMRLRAVGLAFPPALRPHADDLRRNYVLNKQNGLVIRPFKKACWDHARCCCLPIHAFRMCCAQLHGALWAAPFAPRCLSAVLLQARPATSAASDCPSLPLCLQAQPPRLHLAPCAGPPDPHNRPRAALPLRLPVQNCAAGQPGGA